MTDIVGKEMVLMMTLGKGRN